MFFQLFSSITHAGTTINSMINDYQYTELGMWKFCHDNVTMLSSHKVVCNCNFSIFIVATLSRHWGLTIFWFFSGPWLVPEALLRCRVVVVAKLKNCRVPSSVWWRYDIKFSHIESYAIAPSVKSSNSAADSAPSVREKRCKVFNSGGLTYNDAHFKISVQDLV